MRILFTSEYINSSMNMKPNRLLKHQHTLIAIGLFCLTFFVYFYSQNRFIKDSRWAIHVASSIINAGDSDLNEYRQVAENINFTSTAGYGDQLFSYFPVGNSILILPIVWIIEQTSQRPEQQTFYEYLQETSPHAPYLVNIQHAIASLTVALIMPILYYIGYTQFSSRIAIIGVLIFAFGTSAYSTASLVLWQHGPSMLMLTITLALFVRGEQYPNAIQWAGIPLAFSFIIRPTNSIPIVLFTMLVFLRYRRQLPVYILGAMSIALPFFWSNHAVYGSFLSPYYEPQRVGSSPYFTEALIGNLLSPGRGLFLFSPIMLFAFYGIYAKFRRVRLTLLEGSLAIIIILHWILISTFAHWWGGGSYGPRLFTDMMPYMTYFLWMSLHELGLVTKHARFRQMGMGIFMVLAFVSIAIHYVGANTPIVDQWTRWPVGLETHPSVRLWDWEDFMFLRTVEDWPFSSLPTEISLDLENNSAIIPITTQNKANEAYSWEIKVPSSLRIEETGDAIYSYTISGVPTAVSKTAVSPATSQHLSITIDQPLDSFADPSLGAIMVTAKTLLGEEKSVQVIPVSIVNNGRFWYESNALSNTIWLPSDLQVNSDKADSSLYGLYGVGWYALEAFDQYQWRWAQSPAELYVFSVKSRTVTLALVLNTLYDQTNADGVGDTGILHLSTSEEALVKQVSTGEIINIPLSLDKGWNTLTFNLEAGNFSPADIDTTSADRRTLSFSLDSINIITAD